MYLERTEEKSLNGLLGWSEAVALVGPRRAGKTTLALRALEEWKAKGGEGAYVDLESVGAPSTPAMLLKEISSVPKKGLVVLDEVQVLPGWEKAVRQEAEKKQRKIIVTGSSAALLSKEIASSLAGRVIPEQVLCLSYSDARKWGTSSLDEYLRVGGYPECVLRPFDAPRLHKLYLELAVLRDVAARKGIREIKPLSDLALMMLSEPGKTLSSKKTSDALGISQPTFRSFVEALGDAFLVLSVLPFTRSPREKIVSDAKHYAYDTGLQASVSISAQKDEGRRLENVVAIELVRRGYSLSFLREEKGECDFLAQQAGKETLAVQVWGGSGELPARELKGIELGMKTAGTRKGLLLTKEKSGESHEKAQISTIEDWLLKK